MAVHRLCAWRRIGAVPADRWGDRLNRSRRSERICEMSNLVPSPNRGPRRLAERGLTTVEYAIGLLAAAAVALVLLRIFNDNSFFQTLFNWVVDIFGQVAGGL